MILFVVRIGAVGHMPQVEGFYTVSSVSWKPDGSQVVIGGLTGAVDTYDVCLKRVRCGHRAAAV
jgi:hypothetical protein